MKNWKWSMLAAIIIGIPFIIWDEIFTINKFWGFNSDYLVGLNIGHLPIEEVSFFLVVPFACTFIYECVRYYFRKINLNLLNTAILGTLVLYALFLIILNPTGWYTITAGLLALVLVLVLFRKRIELRFVPLSFLISLIPFLIVNGVLTGSGIEEQIVWYNEAQFSSLRIATIPMEDVLYSFSLIVLNILVFEKLRKRNSGSQL